MSCLILFVLSMLTFLFTSLVSWAYWPSELGLLAGLIAILSGPAFWWHLGCRWMATRPALKGGAHVRYGPESARIVSLLAKINAIYAMSKPGLLVIPVLKDVVQRKRDGTIRYYNHFFVMNISTTKGGALLYRGYEKVWDINLDGNPKFRIRAFCDDQIVEIGSVELIDSVVNESWVNTMTSPHNCADCYDAQIGTESSETRCKNHD
jgi:hypothetical protein